MVFTSYTDVAALVGRVALGALFLAHGWPKIKDVKKPIGFVKGTGWPGGALFALLFTLLEFFGGIALIIGFLAQIVANLLPAMVLPALVARRVLLSEDEIAARLREVPGWSRAGNAIDRTWTFRDFSEALAFINKVGALAEAMNPHTDMANSWATVRLTLTTHHKGR